MQRVGLLGRRGSLALLLVLALAASASASSAATKHDSGSHKSPYPKALELGKPTKALCPKNGKTYTIGYEVYSDSADYPRQQIASLNKIAKKLGCVKYVTLVDNATPTTAVANVRTLVQRKVDGVILFQVIASAQPAIANILKQAHVPAIAHAVPAPGLHFLSANDYQAGLNTGHGLAAAFKSRYPGQSASKVWILLGAFPEGGPSVVRRTDGVSKALEQDLPGISPDHVISFDGAGSATTSHEKVVSVLSKIPSDAIIIVSGVNDGTVLGMTQALDQNGRKNVLAGSIGVALVAGVQTVICNHDYVGGTPYFPDRSGAWLVPAIIDLIQGKRVPSSVYTPTPWVTSATLKKIYPRIGCG